VQGQLLLHQLNFAKHLKRFLFLTYSDWLLYESNGLPRLNKMARKIMFPCCPYPLWAALFCAALFCSEQKLVALFHKVCYTDLKTQKEGANLKYKAWNDVLKAVLLFKGMDENEIDTILLCVGSEVKNLLKGEFALLAGDKVTQIGIVLSGELHILRECFDGKRSIIASLIPGDTYAEALYCSDIEESPFSVMAKTDSAVMMLGFPNSLLSCSGVCGFHGRLIKNMLKIVANQNLHLQNRMEMVSMRSVRGKVLRYLESFVPKQGQNIVIPFNREELANFLSVERSALSHELIRMKADNLIDYRKNHFYLKTR
jgi:CRP-like cAMP-binding protein